jgi:hypothetical protein
MKMAVFCEAAPFSFVEIDRRFRYAYCRYHRGDEGSVGGDSKNLWNVGQKADILIVREGGTYTSSYHRTLRNWPELLRRFN